MQKNSRRWTLWFSLSQLADEPHTAAHLFTPGGVRETIRRIEKLWVDINLVQQVKGKENKGKQFISCFPWAGGLPSRLCHMQQHLGKKTPSLFTFPSSPFFSQVYMLSMMLCGTGYPSGHFSCPGCVHLQVPAHPQPPHLIYFHVYLFCIFGSFHTVTMGLHSMHLCRTLSFVFQYSKI